MSGGFLPWDRHIVFLTPAQWDEAIREGLLGPHRANQSDFTIGPTSVGFLRHVKAHIDHDPGDEDRS